MKNIIRDEFLDALIKTISRHTAFPPGELRAFYDKINSIDVLIRMTYEASVNVTDLHTAYDDYIEKNLYLRVVKTP